MIKNIAKKFLNKSGYTLYKNTENPHDPFVQQGKLFDTYAPLVIFDVGANNGQTVSRYKAFFSNSSVYAFEPHPEAYQQLVNNTNKYKNVKTFKLALGNYNGSGDFYINTYSETSSLLQNNQQGKLFWGEGAMIPKGKTSVEVSTLDSFLDKHSISKVDILKLDTQGTEYQIIEGASKSFSQNKVRMIYTEIITLPTYDNQKEIHEIMQVLYDYSFRLYGVYDHRYASKKLASVDAIFINNN